MLREDDGERVEDQVSATINPLAARSIGRYELSVTSSHPAEPEGWGGLSGAGVFASGLLAAVVVRNSREMANHVFQPFRFLACFSKPMLSKYSSTGDLIAAFTPSSSLDCSISRPRSMDGCDPRPHW